jgi:peptide deformylase
MILDIVSYPNNVLHTLTKVISEITDEIVKLADDMAETMYFNNGIGLAANQVNSLHSIIVIDTVTNTMRGQNKSELRVLINPKIVETYGETICEEGCLSFQAITASVRRAKQVYINALNVDGKALAFEAFDLFAISLQHEIDHINGKTFLDRISTIQKSMLIKKMNKVRV